MNLISTSAQVEILRSGSTLCETRLLNKKTTLKGHPSPHTFMAMKHYPRRRKTFHVVSHVVGADKHSFENTSANFREKNRNGPYGILRGPRNTDSRKKLESKNLVWSLVNPYSLHISFILKSTEI